jgi:2-hydroxychromene-2-carboxylate isomerase
MTKKKLSNFESAFASARKKGQKTFTYKGKRYTTETKTEKEKRINKEVKSGKYGKPTKTTRYEPFWSDKRKTGH